MCSLVFLILAWIFLSIQDGNFQFMSSSNSSFLFLEWAGTPYTLSMLFECFSWCSANTYLDCLSLITNFGTIEKFYVWICFNFKFSSDKEMNMTPGNPASLSYLFQLVFGLYMLVTTVVLINLLIAMMSDTYQRIQA